ncbi:hypothetical protein M569_13125, partial [Genlisea aurea]
QAIPTYTMQCFKLPAGLISELNSMLSNFWWSDRGKAKIHFLAWEKLCQAQVHGGLGFRNLATFNTALLAKQCWRIFAQPELLLSQLMKGKYFKSSSFLEARLGRRPSYTWPSLLTARELLVSGLRWCPGDGTQINVWNSPWLPRTGAFKPLYRHPSLPLDLRASDLINPRTGEWDRDKIFRLFLHADAMSILSIPLASPGHNDRIIWHHARDGKYSVRSGYIQAHYREGLLSPGQAQPNAALSTFWKDIWKTTLPPKIILFAWRLCRGILPTKEILRRRKICPDSLCEICQGAEENWHHALVLCTWAKLVWSNLNLP